MATDITTLAAAFVQRYDAMSAMCKNVEAENKRLLQLVIDKDVIIVAGLQREKEANDKHAKLSAEKLDLMQRNLDMMRDNNAFMKEVMKDLEGDGSAGSENDESAEPMNGCSSEVISGEARMNRKRHRADD